MKKYIKKILIATGCILLAVLIFAGGFILHSLNYTVKGQAESIENTTGLVQAFGKSLYDANGNKIVLKGVNAGQILIQEEWMSPFAIEPMKNEDGSYVKDEGGNMQYPPFAEEEFREGLASNPNLKDYTLDELLKIYWDCFFSEEDFRIIKEDLQMNAIRLPFYYKNILNDDLTRKSEEEAFSYLDWFIGMAGKYELYIILDLHGAPGSQNGYEHSGTTSETAGLWTNAAYVDATVDIWDFIADHYTNTAPELGKWIATYDILNEPTYTHKGTTTKECWDVFDRIYDVIRAKEDAHVITMEGCWNFSKLPDPADYGWENVQYEYHWYNWNKDIVPYEITYALQDLSNIGRDYNVPVLIGEFTFFEDENAWAKGLALFDKRNYSWTIWNYKTSVTGWWTSSWGVYTCQLKAVTEWEDKKCNVATCTYEEYVATCEKTKTENCVTDTLYNVIRTYNEKK